MDSEASAPSADTTDRRLALLDELRQSALRAAISRVASVIGHLIGTPLNVITGRAALIRANPTGESCVENARRIEEQVERLAQRIRRLIDYLTLPEPNSQPRSAASVVRDALSLYTSIAEDRGVRIDLTSDGVPDATVEGSSALVVLTSLLSLALRVAPKNSSVELSVERTERSGAMYLLFELRVPGLQAPRTRIDRLDPPDDDESTSTEHLQILSVCYAIARRQGGRLDVVALGDDKAAIRFECAPGP